MSKVRRMDHELAGMQAVLRVLSEFELSGRRRVLAYVCARAESLPLIGAKGEVLDEHPIEAEPPLIRFIHEAPQQTAEAGA
jgi:hypothetical protein